jgi:hypothetical protein
MIDPDSLSMSDMRRDLELAAELEPEALDDILARLAPTMKGPGCVWLACGQHVSALVAAVIIEDQDAMGALVAYYEHDPDADGAGNGRTAAFVAAAEGKTECLADLANTLGADLDIADDLGLSPAYMASSAGHVACLKILRAKGCDLARPSAGGVTPLYAAAKLGHVECLRLFQQDGVDMNEADEYGRTLSYMIAREGHEAALRFLDVKLW